MLSGCKDRGKIVTKQVAKLKKLSIVIFLYLWAFDFLLMKTYKENFAVKWHEIDCDMNLRPYSFMNMAQETANVHSAMLKFGYKELIALNQTWVLSRIKIQYLRPPKWGDKVSMETWHKGKQGLFWLRDFEVRGEQGELMAVATSSWVIMNLQTRRIERKTIFETSSDVVDLAHNVDAVAEPCDKIVPFPELEFEREHHVTYSDIDFNLHANNAKYIQWLMDGISLEFLKEHTFKEVQVNYISEAKFGDKIALYKKEQVGPDGEVQIYYEGSRDGAPIFQGLLKFEMR